MLAQGFYEDVTKILDQTPESRQVLMFSATIDERVRSIIQRYTKDPLDLRLSTDADKVENIQHIIYESSPDFRYARAPRHHRARGARQRDLLQHARGHGHGRDLLAARVSMSSSSAESFLRRSARPS